MSDAAEGVATPAGHVGSVASALKILNLLAESPRSLRLKDIAGPLGLNPSTCLNILRTLVRAGVVHADPMTKTYGPGLALAALARAALARDARLAAARPRLEAVARRHALTAMLWRRSGTDDMVLLSIASGDAAWRVQVEAGSRSPLLQGAMGRVMAIRSGLTRKQLLQRFERLSWDRPLTFDDFMAQAELARDRGWAADEGWFHRSMTSLCVPIVEADGGCDSVLTTAMFFGQHDAAHTAVIAGELRSAAEALAAEPFGPA
jgi:DNA-binding IclR family transcriptional regulator